jgi:hypothetical protein
MACNHQGSITITPINDTHELVRCGACGLERRRVRHIDSEGPSVPVVATGGAEASTPNEEAPQ